MNQKGKKIKIILIVTVVALLNTYNLEFLIENFCRLELRKGVDYIKE